MGSWGLCSSGAGDDGNNEKKKVKEEMGNVRKHRRAGVSNSFSPGAPPALQLPSKGPNVILGLHTCHYSLTVKRELSAAPG